MLSYRGNPFCGGQGVYLYHLSRELARQGHEVTLIVGPPYPEPMSWTRTVRVGNYQFWGKRRGFLPPEKPARMLSPLHFFEFASSRLGYFPEILAFSLRAVPHFRTLHNAKTFEVLHDVETLGYGSLLARKHGVPAVSTVHHPLAVDMVVHLSDARTLLERYYNVVFFPRIMQGLVARRLDGMITSSQVGREQLIRSFRVKPHRVHLVYSGVDLEAFSPDPRVKRNPSELLFVGNAQDPRKGIRYLLQAVRNLDGAVRLKVVDDDGHSKPHAPALAREMGLGHRVLFTGKLPAHELVQCYRAAAVLVMPSLFEGFGLPAAEAMACGTPVIASRAGALPELIGQDQEGGLLVPPGDPDALAAAIRRILSEPHAADALGARGRSRVERLFSWEQTARHTAEVYRRVIMDRRSASR